MIHLNTLSPGKGSKKKGKRLGRGIGSVLGKTGGRGHKGQKSRSGGGVRRGFEGGQIPLYRRLPKFGFVSRKGGITTEVRLFDLEKLKEDTINLSTLKKANIINTKIKYARIVMSGSISRPINIHDLYVTKGARIAIEAAGGKIKE